MDTELRDFLCRPAEVVAPLLLGCLLERKIDGKTIVVKIVETEAYDQLDAASHSYSGRTKRTDVMFGPSGHLYVYFTYGMHYCCNVVTGSESEGSAVLLRAVEPLVGEEYMSDLRQKEGVLVSNGPAKLCQALAINKKFNGHDLQNEPLVLRLQKPLLKKEISQTIRVGITKAVAEPRRFYITGNPYVSKV